MVPPPPTSIVSDRANSNAETLDYRTEDETIKSPNARASFYILTDGLFGV